MKAIRIAVALCAISICGSAQAARHFDFFVRPAFATGFGYNKYIYDQSGAIRFTPDTLLGHVKSELYFPVGAPYAGIGFGLRSKPKEKLDWSVEGSMDLNLGDARKKMTDQDWVDTTGRGGGRFSYTESQSDLHSFGWYLEGRVALANEPMIRFGLVAGVQSQRTQQNLIDAIGWQIYNSAARDTLVIYGLVGKYRVTWFTPYVGIYYRISPTPKFQFDMMSAFAPSWVNDRDDHLLRFFYTDGSANGKGFLGRAKATYELPMSSPGVHPYLELAVDYVSLSAKGTETMIWYGDDPASPEDDTNSSIHGVPHNYISQWLLLGLRLGFLF